MCVFNHDKRVVSIVFGRARGSRGFESGALTPFLTRGGLSHENPVLRLNLSPPYSIARPMPCFADRYVFFSRAKLGSYLSSVGLVGTAQLHGAVAKL
jgi:hypothetical protein